VPHLKSAPIFEPDPTTIFLLRISSKYFCTTRLILNADFLVNTNEKVARKNLGILNANFMLNFGGGFSVGFRLCGTVQVTHSAPLFARHS